MWLAVFFNTIVLLGAIQGFIISTLLFRSKVQKLSACLLGVLLFLIALASLNIFLNTQPWFVNKTFYQVFHALVPWVMILPIGPLLYFYVRSSLEPELKLSSTDRRHFYPVVLEIVPQVLVLVFLIAVAFGFPKTTGPAIGDFIDNYNVYADIPRWVSLSCYILFSYKLLNNPATKVPMATNGNLSEYKWLRQYIRLFMCFQVIWLLHLVPYIIPATRDKLLGAVDWYPVYVPMTILIYVVGIRGYLQLQNKIPQARKDLKLNPLAPAVITQAVPVLHHCMEQEKLYLDQSLNLALLAEHTGIAPKTISAVLNQHLHKSFNEFINEYRVRELQERLLQPQHKNHTIAGLAYDCGFNSLATFQRAFKTVVGVSPTEYMNKKQKTP